MEIVPYSYQGVDLEAPASYVNATPLDRSNVCNGVGPAWAFKSTKLAWLKWLLNRIWGLDCSEIGNIHDWEYHFAEKTEMAKNSADDRFYDNLMEWVHQKSKSRVLLLLRIKRIRKYHYLLKEWGYKAFFDTTV